MSIPEKINIGGHSFAIRVGKDKKYMDAKNLIGNIDFNAVEILVDGEVAPSVVKQVIVHEVLHALVLYGNVMELIKDKESDEDKEEALVKGLENIMYRFLLDNDLAWFKG